MLCFFFVFSRWSCNKLVMQQPCEPRCAPRIHHPCTYHNGHTTGDAMTLTVQDNGGLSTKDTHFFFSPCKGDPLWLHSRLHGNRVPFQGGQSPIYREGVEHAHATEVSGRPHGQGPMYREGMEHAHAAIHEFVSDCSWTLSVWIVSWPCNNEEFFLYVVTVLALC